MNHSDNSSEVLHRRFREARRRAGLTQAALAARVGCMQSAVSMMESGQWSAISRPTLEKIAEILGVSLPAAGSRFADAPLAAPPHLKFCPNAECPSNIPYRVGEEIFLLPRVSTGGERYCTLCGEVLASACASCGGRVLPFAACCGGCGEPYVPAPARTGHGLHVWIGERQREARLLAAFFGGQSGAVDRQEV